MPPEVEVLDVDLDVVEFVERPRLSLREMWMSENVYGDNHTDNHTDNHNLSKY